MSPIRLYTAAPGASRWLRLALTLRRLGCPPVQLLPLSELPPAPAHANTKKGGLPND